MAQQTPIWIGSTAITETPDSPKIEWDANRLMVTRTYEGPNDSVTSNPPVNGQAWQDFPVAVLITRSTITYKPGGIARIEVYGETPGTGNSTTPTYEIEWVEVDRQLMQHPLFAVGQGGAYELTTTDVAMIGKWEEEDNPVLRYAYQYKVAQDNSNPGTGGSAPSGTTSVNGVTFNIYTLSTNAQFYAGKRLKGIDSYRLWAPVARQTIETYDLPGADPCGLIEAPPDAIGAPTGYTYQRSAQRATKTGRYGKWQQQQEWQGADTIDTDLYPSP